MKKVLIILLCGVMLTGCATFGKKVKRFNVKFVESRTVYSFDPTVVGDLSAMRHVDVYFTFENMDEQDVEKLVYEVQFRDGLKNRILKKTFESDVLIKSKTKTDPEIKWVFYDSPDDKDQAFTKLYPATGIGEVETLVEIQEVVFANSPK